MKLHITRQPETLAKLEIAASAEELTKVKNKVLKKQAPQVKMAGFRAGKTPLSLVEKSIDQTVFQSEFLDEAVNMMYYEAIKSEKIRPVAQPTVNVKKFVPFTTLEFDMEVPCVGHIKTADFKKISVKSRKSQKLLTKI